MNSSSSPDQSKIKMYSALTASSFSEIKKIISNTDIPQILDKERSLAIQNTLDAQSEEINNLRQENQILLLQQGKLLEALNSKSNIFMKRFDEFYKAFVNKEDFGINNMKETINKYEEQIQQISIKIQNFPLKNNNNDLITRLQKEISDLKIQNSEIFSQNSHLNKSNEDCQLKLQEYEKINLINNNLITELKTQISHLESQNSEKDSKIAQLQKSQSKDSDDSSGFNFTSPEFSLNDSSGSLKTIDSLNYKIDQLQTSLSQKDELINSLNQMLTDSQTEKSSLMAQIQQKEFEIDELKSGTLDAQSTKLLKQEIENLNKENQMKEDEINSLKHQIEISTSSLKEEQIQSLSSHIVSLANENSQLKNEFEKARDLNKQYFDQLQNLQESKSLLNNANLDLNAKIDELEAKLSQQSFQAPSSNSSNSEILKLKKTIEKNNEKIKLLNKQLKESSSNENIKNELLLIQQENTKITNENQTLQSKLNSVEFSYSRLEKKVKNCEEVASEKDAFIQQLSNSKDEINSKYEETLNSYISTKKKFDQVVNSFAAILGCSSDADQILKSITFSIEKLNELQNTVVTNSEMQKENLILKRQNQILSDQLRKKEDILQSTLGSMSETKESEIIRKFDENFSKINSENSKLIEEQSQLQNKLFSVESTNKELESKLIDQQQLNEELTKKVERIDLFEYVTSHFIEFLSNLSSGLISSLYNDSPLNKFKLSVVSNLLVQLKMRDFSQERINDFWYKFCSVANSSFVFDPIESAKNRIESFDNAFSQKMNLLLNKSLENEKRLSAFARKFAYLKDNLDKVQNPPKKVRLPLFQKSLQSPATFSGSPIYSNRQTNNDNPNLIQLNNPLARDSTPNMFQSKFIKK